MPRNWQTIVKKPPASLGTSGEGGHLGQGKMRPRETEKAVPHHCGTAFFFAAGLM
jgi:hypothetical protein